MNVRAVLRRLGDLAPVLTCLALIVFFASASPTFRTWDNVVNILQQNSVLAIMAVGVTFVLLCAEIDLSIAAVATFSGVLTAFLYVQVGTWFPGMPPVLRETLPMLAVIPATTALGLVNGFGTAWLGLPSFMITLAMWLITQGLALSITKGTPIFEIPVVSESLGTGTIGLIATMRPDGKETFLLRIPHIFLVAVVVLAVGFVVLRYTRFGRAVYMVGGNSEAARLAGINVKAVRAACLTICGFTAGLAGILLIGRTSSAQAEVPKDMLIDCISAVVLGGTSLFGGKGGVANTVVGLLTLGVLHNGLNHVKINMYIKESVGGIILLAALLLNVTMAKMKSAE